MILQKLTWLTFFVVIHLPLLLKISLNHVNDLNCSSTANHVHASVLMHSRWLLWKRPVLCTKCSTFSICQYFYYTDPRLPPWPGPQMNWMPVYQLWLVFMLLYRLSASSRVSANDVIDWRRSKSSAAGVRSHDSLVRSHSTSAWTHYVMQNSVCKHTHIISVWRGRRLLVWGRIYHNFQGELQKKMDDVAGCYLQPPERHKCLSRSLIYES